MASCSWPIGGADVCNSAHWGNVLGFSLQDPALALAWPWFKTKVLGLGLACCGLGLETRGLIKIPGIQFTKAAKGARYSSFRVRGIAHCHCCHCRQYPRHQWHWTGKYLHSPCQWRFGSELPMEVFLDFYEVEVTAKTILHKLSKTPQTTIFVPEYGWKCTILHRKFQKCSQTCSAHDAQIFTYQRPIQRYNRRPYTDTRSPKVRVPTPHPPKKCKLPVVRSAILGTAGLLVYVYYGCVGGWVTSPGGVADDVVVWGGADARWAWGGRSVAYL